MHNRITVAATATSAVALAIAAHRQRTKTRTRDALRRYYSDEALVEARRRIAASEPYRVPVAIPTQRAANDTVELVR